MKHRKFVKQLMGLDPCQDRNTANAMAKCCQQNREPYKDGLERYKQILEAEKRFMKLLAARLERDILNGTGTDQPVGILGGGQE